MVTSGSCAFICFKRWRDAHFEFETDSEEDEEEGEGGDDGDGEKDPEKGGKDEEKASDK